MPTTQCTCQAPVATYIWSSSSEAKAFGVPGNNPLIDKQALVGTGQSGKRVQADRMIGVEFMAGSPIS